MKAVRHALFMMSRDVVLNWALASPLIPMAVRWRLYRAVGMPIENCRICPGAWFGNRNIRIGRGTFVNYGARFNTAGGISIGQDCDVAMDVSFVTSSHDLGGPGRRAGRSFSAPITVGDGAWIGARATILPGVTIGDGAVVAAGAVVADDCDAHSLYAGVPARKVRHLESVRGADAVPGPGPG